MSTIFGTNFNGNYLWIGILIGIIIVCAFASRHRNLEYYDGTFIPSVQHVVHPKCHVPHPKYHVEHPKHHVPHPKHMVPRPKHSVPHRLDKLYLGGPTKCFSCEKQMIKRGLPTYLAHPTKCFDCDVQSADSYGSWAGHFGQNNKCFSCEAQYAQNPYLFTGVSKHPRSKECKKVSFGHKITCGHKHGQKLNYQINSDGFDSKKTCDRHDGLGDQHEGDTQNPVSYSLN